MEIGMNATTWPRLPIVSLCEAHVDCVNRTAPVVSKPTPFKMLRTTNVRNGYIDVENVRYVTKETYKKWTRRLVPKRGDIILTREAPLGDVGKIRTEDAVFLGQRLYHFRPDPEKLDADFLLYSLLSDDLQSQIRGFGSGSTVEHMRLEDIPSLELWVPPLAIQRRIAGILSAYDELIENNQRRIKILESMARSIYREWFVKFRFPGHENHPMVDSPLGNTSTSLGARIPKGWEVKKLASVAQTNRAQINVRNAPSEVHYIDISSVSPGQIESINTISFCDAPGRARRIVGHGDILWSCVRPNRRAHVLILHPEDNTIASTGFAVLSATKVPFTFLYLATTTDSFVAFLTNNATGAAYPAVTAATFEDADLLVPSEPLLRRFAGATLPIAEQIYTLRIQSNNLRRTRDLLLPRLMSGQIDLRES
jgi:type I restriction enzyme S subunit